MFYSFSYYTFGCRRFCDDWMSSSLIFKAELDMGSLAWVLYIVVFSIAAALVVVIIEVASVKNLSEALGRVTRLGSLLVCLWPSDHWYSSDWNGCNWRATLFFVQIFLLKIELILGNGVFLISYYDESYDKAIVRSSLIDKFSLVRLDDIRLVLNNWIDDITSRVVQPPALTEELRWRLIVPSRLKSFVVSKAKINQKDGGGGFP